MERSRCEQISRTPPDNTIIDESFASPLDMEQQFGLMANKVNETIHSISAIYNEIGYSSSEIAEKKSEVFRAMNNTIASFKCNLEREKNNISNECEWLRQQIRVILAMLNDNSGEKYLKLSSRGIVFDDEVMYREGLQSPSPMVYVPAQLKNPQFQDDASTKFQSEFMLKNHPNLSLLQYKSRLNSIFLEVLKSFVKVFKKFNEVNRLFWENLGAITEDWQDNHNSSLLYSIPRQNEAEEQAALIEEFESTLDHLQLTNRNYKPELRQGLSNTATEDVAFIISSPRKSRLSLASPENNVETHPPSDEGMNRLRDINYKLVHAIRGIKVTKITNEVISQLSKEAESVEKEIDNRMAKMKEIISDCLDLISVLSLTDEDLISVQKMQERDHKETSSVTSTSSSKEGFLDINTLKFLQKNPRQFGLMDHHLNFITGLAHALQRIKDTIQKKWEQYSRACVNLWEKLGENRNYTERFINDNSYLTDMSLNNFKLELKRLHAKRSEYVDSFIIDARNEISELQSKLLYSEARCKEFKYFVYDVNENSDEKEQVLNEHEAEIERLKADYTFKEPVLTLYSQLKDLLEDQKFLAESSKDSSRLLSKNSCKILLNEEKIRKKINRNLPRVLASLKQELVNFNDKLLSEGLLPITVGNHDMFEKVLLIESQANTHGGKVTRGNLYSPNKSRSGTSTRSSSPKKVNFSPSRVQKAQPQRRSPALSDPGQVKGRGISPRPQVQRSALPRSRISPTQKSDGLSNKISPRNTGRHMNEKKTSLEHTVLVPLNTSLAPSGVSSNGSSPSSRTESSNSIISDTPYSMCSRVSPLKSIANTNRSFLSSLSLSKPCEKVRDLEEHDKENSFIGSNDGFGGPLQNHQKHSTSHSEDTRLSVGSLANSTIVGDDYQKWREERIKALNVNDLE
ncbi:hypothetical protein JCM33374_g3086 [Metschnikowia sp. JCM 33374]|nr:hypothetical protein JCM33374_g3086 [Metschnikowia sp. JCM 33374]